MLAIGLPVAFSFMFINLIGVYLWWGGVSGLHQLIISMYGSISRFSLLPVSMFVLLAEVLFHSGLAIRAIDTVDMWIGRIPGRLSIVAVGAGTLLSALSGSSLGSTAMLGSLLLPDMKKRGYDVNISVGPIMAGGGLAAIIPPSALAVVLATIMQISVGKLLISGIVPGLVLALSYVIYIILKCYLQPSIAPSYTPQILNFSERILATFRYVIPLVIIIIAVTGFIFLNIATPTESAAIGAFASFIMAVIYKKLNWKVVKTSFSSTLEITIMLFFILTGATAFSQILAYTGASAGLTEFATSLPLNRIALLIVMLVVVLVLGCFMEPVSIMMITIPIFLPIVKNLGFDPLWFGLLTLIGVETGLITPPFGLILYAMKAVVPPEISIGQIIRGAMPFVLCNIIVMFIIIAFPKIATWLPSIMK